MLHPRSFLDSERVAIYCRSKWLWWMPVRTAITAGKGSPRLSPGWTVRIQANKRRKYFIYVLFLSANCEVFLFFILLKSFVAGLLDYTFDLRNKEVTVTGVVVDTRNCKQAKGSLLTKIKRSLHAHWRSLDWSVLLCFKSSTMRNPTPFKAYY